MKTVIDELTINYEVEGEGYPIIMLHGWLANLETMEPLKRALVSNFKVYNVDVIGFGKSDLPNRPYSTNDFGDFLKKFAEKLNIENPILIGHSNGGRTIINCVGRGLIKPKKIILIDSAGIKPKRKIKYFIRVYTYKFCKNILKMFPNNDFFNELREKLVKKFSSEDYKNSPEVLRRTMSIILNEDQRELLKNIDAPTLLIWGTNDTATPIEDAKLMEKLIPDAGIVEFKGAGHFSYLERLNETVVVIREFLKNEIK